MGTIVNPKTATVTDPTTATDATGATVAWDPSTDKAGYAVSIDGAAVVDVPVAAGVNTIDLTSLAAYEALPAGAHSLTVADVTKEGVTGKQSAAVTFSVDKTITPDAPSVKLS